MAIARTEQRERTSTNLALVGIAAVSLAVFALFAVAVWHLRTPIGLDDVLASAPRYSRTLHRLAWLGSPTFAAIWVTVAALVAYAWRDNVAVAVCVAGPVLAGVAGTVAKPVVHRMIGPALAYPSGHATLAAALAAVIVWMVYRRRGRHAAALTAIAAAAIPLAVSIAVVRLGWHYSTDAIGGIALGVGTVCATAAALDKSSENGRTS
jgi:membrane-associated phospholipid phosphatase